MTDGAAGPATGQSRTKTVVIGLKGALQRSSDLVRISDLVRNVSEERFHTYGLLDLYAVKLARSSLEVIGEQFTNEKHKVTGEVFNVNIVNQAWALVHAGGSPGAPELLVETSKEYFSGPLALVRATRPDADLQHCDVRKASAEQLKTALSNCMEYATPANQKAAVRQLYDLTNKEAKRVCSRLSTSSVRLVEKAIEAHVKRHNRIALKKRDELDKAIRDGDAGAEQLQREYDTLEKGVEKRRREAKLNPLLAAESLAAENPLGKRVRPTGFVGPLLPLDEVIRREREHVPDTQSQLDQLLYRASLIGRLEACGASKAFNLTPAPAFGRSFVSFIQGPALPLAKLESKSTLVMAEILPRIFKPKVLKAVITDSWVFGDSFRTDGIQLHFGLVNSANREGKKRQRAAEAATKAAKTAGVEAQAGEEKAELACLNKWKKTKEATSFFGRTWTGRFDGEKKHGERLFDEAVKTLKRKVKEVEHRTVKRLKAEKKPAPEKKDVLPKRKAARVRPKLPEGATLVGLDTGVRNLCGVAREDDMDNGYTITSGEYYHKTGIRRGQKELDAAAKWARLNDPAFQAADRAVSDARTKTVDAGALLLALHARGGAYRTLYAFYGAEGLARQRFRNYQGAQRVLHSLVERIAPLETDVVVVGDANFGSNIRGLPPGVAGRLVKTLERELGKERVLWGDEFRSSMLDSNTHEMMFHPPKELGVNSKTGKTYIRHVYGIYQSSTPGYSCTWDRDVNAARNIVKNFRHAYHHGCLPAEFRRETKLVAPVCMEYRYRLTRSSPQNKFSRYREVLISADGEA